MISKEVFTAGMKRLESAFMKDVTQPTLKLYSEKLQGFSDKNFKRVVETIIDNDNFFPSIARFKQHPFSQQEIIQHSLEEMIS